DELARHHKHQSYRKQPEDYRRELEMTPQPASTHLHHGVSSIHMYFLAQFSYISPVQTVNERAPNSRENSLRGAPDFLRYVSEMFLDFGFVNHSELKWIQVYSLSVHFFSCLIYTSQFYNRSSRTET